MNSYIREILRWWELKMRLRKCKTPEERAHVRRSVSQKYRTKKKARSHIPPRPLPPRYRASEAEQKAVEAEQSELRG